jgi:hypothetical protein
MLPTIPAEKVREVRKMRREKMDATRKGQKVHKYTLKELGAMCNVSERTMWDVIKGNTYKWVGK